MKYSGTFSAIPKLAALFLVASDSSNPEIILDASFPQPRRSLLRPQGEAFQRRQGRDTIRYRLSTSQEFTVTTAASGYALPASAPNRAVYYYNPLQQDKPYFNYTVNVQDNLIHGLNSGIKQNASWPSCPKKAAQKAL